MVWDAAIAAHTPEQALRDDAEQGCAHHERFNAHFVESGDGARGIVAVQGGQDQVSCQSCFDGSFCCFLIAGLTHQQHIWVLAHERAKGSAEVKSFLSVYLALGNTRQCVFNWIFYSRDIDPRFVAFGQQRIKSCGFARACGSGHKNHAEWF